ncbi:hypothetical protein ACRQ1B_25635 [Rhizobium panacihumi]|uniref:hypothetical protein n=1 Tax=Rhizobium panacihumi TaxID=2008450 RepID=UPI003D7ACCB2
MGDKRSTLQLAVDDNVAWCSAVCDAHRSDQRMSANVWVNLNPSPPFYPNIITRRPGPQSAVLDAIEQIRARNPSLQFGIKDSFADLQLDESGFRQAISGSWYGGLPFKRQLSDVKGWEPIASEDDLRCWETHWGGTDTRRIFPASLLDDKRIKFWRQKQMNADGVSGFVSFYSEASVGLSNWFTPHGGEDLPDGALDAVATIFPEVPVVLWSSSDLTCANTGLERLAPLRIWLPAH